MQSVGASQPAPFGAAVGVSVTVGVFDGDPAVRVEVAVDVPEGVEDTVRVCVGVSVWVCVGMFVTVAVGVTEAVPVAVSVWVLDAVIVGVSVAVPAGVSVGVEGGVGVAISGHVPWFGADPSGHVIQSVEAGPVQVAQVTAQLPQMVSEVLEQAAIEY